MSMVMVETLITVHPAGRFLGELNLLTGQRLFLSARVARPGRVLVDPPPEFRRLMSSKPDLADLIFRAFVGATRPAACRARQPDAPDHRVAVLGAGARACGRSRPAPASPTSGSTSRTPTTSTCCSPAWACASATPRSSSPPSATLRRPTPGDVRRAPGLTFRSPPGYLFDLVVVGSGPAGPGGGGLRRIRGPRHGVARRGRHRRPGGRQLADRELRGLPQRHLGRGAHRRAPRCRRSDSARGSTRRAGRGDQARGRASTRWCSRTAARCPRVRSSWRRVRGTGASTSTTSSGSRARACTTPPPTSRCALCAGSPVVVVGGGNSAGPGRALTSRSTGAAVTIAIRARRPRATDVALPHRAHRSRPPHRAAHRHRGARARRRPLPRDGDAASTRATGGAPVGAVCGGLFCFIGADAGDRLARRRCVALDQRWVRAHRPRRCPATSLDDPVFASPRAAARSRRRCPVCSRSATSATVRLKRVAAAVGEGSSAVRSVHEYLASAR